MATADAPGHTHGGPVSPTSTLSRARLRAVTVLVAIAALLVGLAPPAPAAPRTDLEAVAETMLAELHVLARTSPSQFGVSSSRAARPFEAWGDLRDTARRWSDAQARGRCPGTSIICHNTVANGGPGYSNEFCCWSRTAENVGWTGFAVAGSRPTERELRDAARQLMNAYMRSASHRDAILDPAFDHFGTSLSLVDTGRGTWRMISTTVFRQHDGRPIDSEPIPVSGSPTSATLLSPTASGTCRTVPETRFRDLDPRSTVGVAAGCLGDRGITSGHPDGTYRPEGVVNRAQMASFLVRTLDDLGRPAPAATGAPFRDVSGPHAGAIARLHAAGITGGRTDGTFGPGDNVTRGQMAAFLARTYEYAAGQRLPSGPLTFRDIRGTTHEADIVRLASAGIAAGTGSGDFSPSRRVTRGQMAQFLTRLLERHAMD